MIRLVVAILLLASPAFAGSRAGWSIWDDLVQCSTLPDPAEPSYNLTSADDLHTAVTTNCGSGCILNLAPGTYTDERVTIGPASEVTAGRVRAGSLTTATGEILIRAQDPANPPTLRAVVGAKTGVFYFVNVTARVRLENLIIDGRRGSQTADAIGTICTDTTPANGICDSSGQSLHNQNAFWTSSLSGLASPTQSCIRNVSVVDTVSDAFFIRDAIDTTVENVAVNGIGCDATLCPSLNIPSDGVTNSLKTVARGVNIVSSGSRVGVVGSSMTWATKFGAQCFGSTDCHIYGNRIQNIGLAGIEYLGSSGSVRGNLVEYIGLYWDHNTLNDYTGFGISWTTDNTFPSGLTALFEENRITNTFGAGFTSLMPSFPGGSDANIVISRNVVTAPCVESTRPTEAGMSIGDNGDTIATVRAVGNRVVNNACDSAFRIQRINNYDGRSNSVSGTGTDPAVIYDDVTGLDEDGLVVNEDIQVDAGSAGTLTNCTLNSGAAVVDSSAGAVVRTNCGP